MNKRDRTAARKDRLVRRRARSPEPKPPILRDAMFEGVLAASPSFEPAWRAFCEEWRDERDKPYYLLISELARHVIALFERKEATELRAIFREVERWHLEGERYVQEAATVGMLEDLQNLHLHTTTTPDDFVQFLGPESRYWWGRVIEFWETGKLLYDDRPERPSQR